GGVAGGRGVWAAACGGCGCGRGCAAGVAAGWVASCCVLQYRYPPTPTTASNSTASAGATELLRPPASARTLSVWSRAREATPGRRCSSTWTGCEPVRPESTPLNHSLCGTPSRLCPLPSPGCSTGLSPSSTGATEGSGSARADATASGIPLSAGFSGVTLGRYGFVGSRLAGSAGGEGAATTASADLSDG